MGSMVYIMYSISWVMQDLYHQPYVRLGPRVWGLRDSAFLVSIAVSCCRLGLPHPQGRHSTAARVASAVIRTWEHDGDGVPGREYKSINVDQYTFVNLRDLQA